MTDLLFAVLRITFLVYVGMILVLAGCQRHMMYYPTRTNEENAKALARTDGLEPWRDAEGTLIGWRPVNAQDAADIMLLFHGNAGFAAQRGYFAHGFAPYFTVYIMEYPGYGTRPGRPGEKAFYAAATQALEDLAETYPDRQLFLGGESLGSGVTAYLAGTYPDQIAGVFLSTPFDSLVAVARHHYPIFPVRWFMRDRYPSAQHLENYQGPLALLIAGEDEVVPAKFGQRLAEAYDGPTRVWLQENRNHNTLDLSAGSTWWSEVAQFLRPPDSDVHSD